MERAMKTQGMAGQMLKAEREDNFHESQSESFGTIMRALCILYTLRLTEALGNTGPN